MEKVKKIIIDTDIGDDIDDLLALVYALNSDDYEILGVTTSYLNTNLRAREARKAILLSSKKNIPVYAGIGLPLRGLHSTDVTASFSQFTPDLLDPTYAPINDEEGCQGLSAPRFINAMAKKYGAELTIVCLAPLTNIAKAIELEPNALLATPIVMMGGCYSKLSREWNIECDYAAAKKVFSSPLHLTCLGSDITKLTQLDSQEEQELLSNSASPIDSYRTACVKMWKKATSRMIVLHDPLALYSVSHPEICSYEERHVFVETEGSYGRGLTLPLEDLLWVTYKKEDGARCAYSHIAVAVDAVSFKKAFLQNAKNA
jgi:purine nucleosidase